VDDSIKKSEEQAFVASFGGSVQPN